MLLTLKQIGYNKDLAVSCIIKDYNYEQIKGINYYQNHWLLYYGPDLSGLEFNLMCSDNDSYRLIIVTKDVIIMIYNKILFILDPDDNYDLEIIYSPDKVITLKIGEFKKFHDYDFYNDELWLYLDNKKYEIVFTENNVHIKQKFYYNYNNILQKKNRLLDYAGKLNLATILI